MKKRMIRLYSLVIKFILGHQLPDLLQPVCSVDSLLDSFDVVNLAFVSRPNKRTRRVVRVKGRAFALARSPLPRYSEQNYFL